MAYRFVLPFADVGNGISPADGALLTFFDEGTSNPKTTWGDFALTVPNASPIIADSDGVFGDIFLSGNADVSLTDKDLVPIFTGITVYDPGNSVGSLAASVVTVLDAGGNFVATNVETVLAEIATDYQRQNRAETITGTKTFSGADIGMADNLITRPAFTDYGITHNVVTSVSGVLELDLETGNSFVTTLFENVTTLTLSNPPATGTYGQFTLKVIQDGASGAFTFAWPATVLFPGGADPVISTGNDAVDEITAHTIDATEWLGNFSQAYA